MQLFNQCFPYKSTKQKNRINKSTKNNNPQLVECKNRLDVLLMLSRFDANNYKIPYILEKKKYDNLLIEFRSSRYHQKLLNSDNKSKCMWSIFKEITGKNDNDSSELMIEGNSEYISNKYNDYLLSVIPEIIKNIKNVPFHCTIKYNSHSMFLSPVTQNEIEQIAKSLKNQHSSGIDEIPTSIIKQTAHTQPVF